LVELTIESAAKESLSTVGALADAFDALVRDKVEDGAGETPDEPTLVELTLEFGGKELLSVAATVEEASL
jgi:hypothetical protein